MPHDLKPPAPDASVDVTISGLPIRLWWKIMEEAGRKNLPPAYFIFRTLAEKVGYEQDGESYDLLLAEIKEHLGLEP